MSVLSGCLRRGWVFGQKLLCAWAAFNQSLPCEFGAWTSCQAPVGVPNNALHGGCYTALTPRLCRTSLWVTERWFFSSAAAMTTKSDRGFVLSLIEEELHTDWCTGGSEPLRHVISPVCWWKVADCWETSQKWLTVPSCSSLITVACHTMSSTARSSMGSCLLLDSSCIAVCSSWAVL